MTTPEPYQSCPCGSGEKYKFCCRPKGKFKEPRENLQIDIDDWKPEPDPEPPRRRGFADAIGAYAQPLIDETDGSPKQVQKALNIAMLCWNLALHETMNKDGAINKALIESGMPPEDLPLFLRDVVEPMIQRHREMFPRMHSG
jgi:hypothetical protein